MGRVWPNNGVKATVTDYTAPHPQSVAIMGAFQLRKNLENAGLGGIIKWGIGARRYMGWLEPIQSFRGGAPLIGNTDRAAGLVTGLPSPEPPGGRVPTIYDLLVSMDATAGAGLTNNLAGR